MHKVKTIVKEAGAKEWIGREDVKPDVKALIKEYALLLERETAAKDRKREILDYMKDYMKKTGQDDVSSDAGSFQFQIRRSLSWSVAVVKACMGRDWAAFIKADDALLKTRMGSGDAIGAALSKSAEVEEKEVVTFKS